MSIGDILPGILAECGLDVLAPDISSSDFQMRQIRALIDAAGKDISTRAQWAGSLNYDTIPASATAYALPGDFQEMANGGAILQVTSGLPIRPITDTTVWQFLVSNPSDALYYHIFQNGVLFSSEIPAGGATFYYVSKNWLGNKAAVTDNADQPVFSEDLLARGVVWRWRRQKGLDYEDLMAEFESDLDAAILADRGA